jgi:ribosomal protein S18 acetylase RimI-like enzyme
MNYTIRPKQDSDEEALSTLMLKTWHTVEIITRGKLYPVIELEGLVATQDNELIGFVLYRYENSECEVVVLQSLEEGQGIGTKLMLEVISIAKDKGCTRVWLITTNDNIHAMHFYQRLGFSFSALYRNAMEISRQMKPQIPLLGHDGIPLKHEIEFEFII